MAQNCGRRAAQTPRHRHRARGTVTLLCGGGTSDRLHGATGTWMRISARLGGGTMLQGRPAAGGGFVPSRGWRSQEAARGLPGPLRTGAFQQEEIKRWGATEKPPNSQRQGSPGKKREGRIATRK